ncbi:SRPBCC family protein [Streptomyces telluris]|uniref:SRPBCC family protein n=1 Tax=Streptomyces telluris TaxID=2720021 RepID=A0A9X2RPV8_9ACTN|nr:SRPBCC family protein [Streptomyces telluris]MCQ8771886.1 SRPBCC family protein [Streptomyces telluris]NJP80034.1 SRPBCC family protein [Streptomyces telluris]
MTERKAAQRGAGTSGGLRERVQGNPGANRLVEEAEAYVQARLEHMLEEMVHRLEDSATRLGEAHLGPHALVGAIGKGGQRLKEGASPSAAVLSAVASHAKDALVEKVKEVSGKRRDEKRRGSPSGGRSLTIVEDVEVGVPVREAYDQWTQFQDFGRFAKGVVNVEKEDDTTTQWHVKIAKASRHWQGMVTEMVPDERIAWVSEGAKGTTKGVVTFHPLADNLTKVLLVMEYFPQGLVEKTGALLRAQGRRARLDLKLYRTFLTVRGEATGEWRGEIRDGEVVREPGEDAYEGEADEYRDEEPRRAGESGEPYDEEDEEDEDARSDAKYDDRSDEAYEDRYDDEYEEEEPEPHRSRR